MKTRPNWTIVFGGLFLDQSTKIVANHFLRAPIHIIENVFIFQLVHNYGAAYGILQHKRLLLLSISVIVIVGAIGWSHKFIQSKWSYYGISFLLIGAIGNFIDRLRLGYVIDFIDIRIFPVFNIADVCIDIAILCLLIEVFKKPNEAQPNNKS